MRRGTTAVLTALVASAALLLSASPAEAASGPTGADVSWPQCGRALPVGEAFAVVGVNGGTATSPNPCLAEQLLWASTSPGVGRPALEVYVNTADPSPSQASFWPTSDRTRSRATVHSPYGHCTGGATRACAWVYGASLAADDLEKWGASVPPVPRWWLDVESGNTWSRTSTARNRAALEGMAALFTARHHAVGLYAARVEFHDVIGDIPATSGLAHLPSWLAGARDAGDAAHVCTHAPLAGGRLTLVQWQEGSGTAAQDRDLACSALPTPPKPAITGTALIGRTLHVKAATWKPGGVHLARQWTRDGKPIAKATGSAYRLESADRGHRVGVTVTGTKTGFSRAVRSSASKRVH